MMQKVLIAEDEPQNRLILQRFVQRLGYETAAVDDGLKVIEILSKDMFDLILMDISMPSQDGIETTKIIRNSSNFRDIPVILISGDEINTLKDICFEVGANACISKPVEFIQIKENLEKFL